MKLLFLALMSSVPTISSAFVYRSSSIKTSTTSLFAVRPDTSTAIEAALEASKKYGATSPEARIAWDAVEEMDASDNSAAFAGNLDTDCSVDEASDACLDYANKLDELATLVKDQVEPSIGKLKNLALDLEAVKLSVPQPKAGVDSPALRTALENAKKLSYESGSMSPEAKVAWAEVEEIASAGTSNAMGKRLDQDCLVDSAMEACKALEELNKALQQDNNEL